MTDLEFVNDWTELEAAVAALDELYCRECADWPERNEYEDAVRTIKDYVPRLLTQYAKLLELSFALTEGWEQYAPLQAPSGLYLPDHR
jgi:hypothetical protein